MRARLLIGFVGVGLVIAWGQVASWMDFRATAPADQREVGHRSPSAATHELMDDAVASPEPAFARSTQADDEENWRRLRAEPDSPGRRDRMLAMVEKLAARDPELARTFALGEADPEMRARLLGAMMRGWAQHDFDAAARWARAQSGLSRERMLAALFLGASERPEVIIAFARTLSSEEPDQSKEVGAYLIHALSKAGNHESAAAFAAEGDGKTYDDWLVSAYSRWGYKNPEEAVLHAIALTDPRKRLHAFRAAVTGWAQTDPQSLLETAKTFPDGSEKTFSMTVGLREWVEQDAAAVARWVASNQRWTLVQLGGLPRSRDRALELRMRRREARRRQNDGRAAREPVCGHFIISYNDAFLLALARGQ